MLALDLLEEFTATLQKGGLIAIPAATRERLRLKRRKDNHLLRFSFRRSGRGRWNNGYARLTYDNEFALPSNSAGLAPGDAVDVKIRQLLVTTPAPVPANGSAASLLLEMARSAVADGGPGVDGIDDYLNREAREGSMPKRGGRR